MQENNLTEEQVDDLILSLIKNHSLEVTVDEQDFMDLLKFSLSLNTWEKKRVIDAIPTLSQFQFDELKKVFTEERGKFRDLAKQHPDDIKKLVSKQNEEWLELWDLYYAEMKAKEQESDDQSKIDDIKSSLGL